MHKATKLFRIFGIDIQLHYSWWFIFILLAWSLSASFFPALCSGSLPGFTYDCSHFTTNTYWFVGIIAALLLFVSVLLHELSHSLVAKLKKIQVKSITLFFFGGVAGIEKEEMKPSSEFLMAIAGPLFSLLLAGIFFLIFKFNGNVMVAAITYYLWQLNLILAIFNMVPGFPLDGGRALRAILHWYYKDLKKATRIAAAGGKIVAGALIILGVIGLISGVGGGLWFILIGGFLYFIAGVSYDQVIIKDVLGKIKVSELMDKSLPVVKPEMRFKEFTKQYSSLGKTLFLVRNKTFSGVLDLNRINVLPTKLQDVVKVKQISLPFNQIKGIDKNDNLYNAFRKFAEQKVEILPVLSGKEQIGVITREAVMNRLQWDMKFSGNGKKIRIR